MTAANFQPCLDVILANEGGYVNDPRDPGGETNYGISKRAYPSEDIRNMTVVRAGNVYRRDYWNKISGDDLPDGIDLVAFDPAVNSGPGQGAKWLQQALGVKTDGGIGPLTIAAAAKADPLAVIEAASTARLGWLHGLRTWGAFGQGWAARVASVEAKATAMAAAAKGLDVAQTLSTKAEAAKSQAQAHVAVVRNTVTGGAISGGLTTQANLPPWAIAAGAAALVLGAIVFTGQRRAQDARAAAFTAAAKGA